jgi:hypothetical protein
MLFERRLREGIADGTVTVAFRRWRRTQVVAGGRYRTGTDRIEVDAVDVVDPESVSAEDARLAGYDSPQRLWQDLRGTADLPVYRIRFHRLDGPDPRAELAAAADLTDADVAELDRRLDRVDRAGAAGAWTARVLALIAVNPGVAAATLAGSLGSPTQEFKRRVRTLKGLGLTRSLPVGYELAPRGEAYLRGTTRA